MRKDLLITALGLCLIAGPAAGEVLATPETDPATAAAPRPVLPAKGATMAAVEKKFGAPAEKRAPVGGGNPRHPPITRWDYAGFSVFFEHDRVVDAVVPGAPPRVYHKDQLTPVAASAAPLPPMPPPAEAPPEEEPIVPEAPVAPPAEPPAEAAAVTPPPAAEPEAPAESAPPPPPATPEPYPDRPPSPTPAEEIPEDAPPTPK